MDLEEKYLCDGKVRLDALKKHLLEFFFVALGSK
jgi:hypothetical protein